MKAALLKADHLLVFRITAGTERPLPVLLARPWLLLLSRRATVLRPERPATPPIGHPWYSQIKTRQWLFLTHSPLKYLLLCKGK